MSKVYIQAFTEENVTKWGLFFEDKWGKTKHLDEDFKHLAFDTQAEAEEKLAVIEAERRSEDAAVAFSTEEAKAFAEGHRWKFATTYAKTAPHEYLVKRWLPPEERLLFERLVQTIKRDAVLGYFHTYKNYYLILGEYYYWFMTDYYPENYAVDLINRSTIDNLECRDGVYYYKSKNVGD